MFSEVLKVVSDGVGMKSFFLKKNGLILIATFLLQWPKVDRTTVVDVSTSGQSLKFKMRRYALSLNETKKKGKQKKKISYL